MEEKNCFNKLQYSKFIGQDQFVVRSNDKAEFIDLVGFIDDFVAKQVKTEVKQEKQILPSEALGKCAKCGAPNKLSKQGKIYCSNTCWLKDKQYGNA